MRFIVREVNFNVIIMSSEFEALSKTLMVEIIRRRQLQLVGASLFFKSQLTFPVSFIHILLRHWPIGI